MTVGQGIEPGPYWRQASALSSLRQPCSLFSTFIAIVAKPDTRAKCIDPLEVYTAASSFSVYFVSISQPNARNDCRNGASFNV